MTGHSRSLALAASLLLGALLWAPTSAAQVPGSDNPWEEGREAYAAGDWARARVFVIEAIQRDPENARYYLALARIEYWLESYETSVWFYDLYLGPLASKIGSGVRDSDRPARVREERDNANRNRPSPNAAVAGPDAGEQARAAFEDRLAEGPILTTTGGGVFALYQGILRSGYANPALLQIRSRLANALVAEARSVADDSAPAIPYLTLVQWQTQCQRWQEWQALTPEPAAAAGQADSPWRQADANVAFCEGQLQFLNGNPDTAARRFQAAIEAWPEHLPARLGYLNALLQGSGTVETPVEALRELESRLQSRPPQQIAIAKIYRAAFASRSGATEEAARTLGELFGLPW